MLKLNYTGLSYVYFYILALTIGILIYHIPFNNNYYNNVEEYDYLLVEEYIHGYLNYDLNNYNSWQTNEVGHFIDNPKNYKYAIIKINIPKNIDFLDNLHIETHRNNFDVYKKGSYIKTNTPIQNTEYITTSSANSYTITEIEHTNAVYIYMETNDPLYTGYLNKIKIVREENISKVFTPYFLKFLMFIVCFIYSLSFLLYVYISKDYTENKSLRKITLTMMLFTIFIFTDSSIIFSYFSLIEWSKINTIALCLLTSYSIYSIASTLKNEKLKRFVSFISYSFIPFLAFLYYLDYNKIVYYSISYNYLILFIIICLIILLISIVSNSSQSSSKLLVVVNCVFILIFVLEYINNINVLNFHLDNILSSFVLIFVFFTFVLLKGYIERNLEMQKTLDLVLRKKFETNTIIECINRTISSDYDINIFCQYIHSSVKKIIDEEEVLEITIFKIDENADELEILYDTTGMHFFRLEIEDQIKEASNMPNNIYKTSNKRRVFFSVKQGKVDILVALSSTPYFSEKDLAQISLYLQSIKKSLENILIYASSIHNQESVLQEIVKIINEKENYKFNTLAIGDLSYYLATKLNTGYTKAMQCKIVSYAINIGKLDISSNILKEDVLSAESIEEFSNYINITHNMVKHYDNSIMKLATIVTSEYYEKYDGSGKKGLKGDEINLHTRIIRIAINMVYYYLNKNTNSYNKYNDALRILKIQSNVMFDPNIINILENNEDEVKEVLKKYL